jgi:DNA topoisomerase-3
METAGKDIGDVELREAMKDSGIGTPATRAAIIERLIAVEYIERDGRALHATEKGVQVIRLLGGHELTSPELTGEWERRLELIAQGEESRPSFMNDITKFTRATVEQLDGLKGVRIERANLGPCPVCGKDVNENRKGYSCWSKDDPGCGFVIWKKKAQKTLPASVVKELMASLKESLERGDETPTGRTAKQVTGFRGRSGRSFRAKLKIVPADEGKWRVDFDEEWATNGAQPKDDAGEEGEAKAA